VAGRGGRGRASGGAMRQWATETCKDREIERKTIKKGGTDFLM
jgi:hypothetical protein